MCGHCTEHQLKEEVERRTKAAGDLEAKLKVAETEQQHQAKAAADADSKRRAAETEQQRLKEEVERQTKAAGDAIRDKAALDAALVKEQAKTRDADVTRENLKQSEKNWCYETLANACWRAQGCVLKAGKCVPQ